MTKTLALTDENFEESISQPGQVYLVDFWAEWCGPCKMISPILDELAIEYDDKITIAKVNIDDNPKIPQQFAVRGIPTMILFKNGEPVDTKVGALPKEQIKEFIDSNI